LETLIFQWDKACDVMPILRPGAKILFSVLTLYFLFVAAPSMVIPMNEHRPMPNQNKIYDSVSGKYVDRSELANYSEETYSESEELSKLVLREQEVSDEIVSVNIGGGISSSSDSVLGEEAWDYMVEVAYLVDSALGRRRLKLDTGIYVDSRDLRFVSEHRQSITLDPPTKAGANLVNFPVRVKTMRNIVTRCAYYSIFLYGEDRLVLGGPDVQEINTNCI